MLRLLSLLVLALACAVTVTTAATPHPLVTQSLDSATEWQLTSANSSLFANEASVPGSVYTDLNRAGVLPDLWYRFNPVTYEFVTRDTAWFRYQRTFDAGDALLALPYQELVLYGIDLLANISVNGRLVMQTSNQFRRWTADVSGLLKSSDNMIEILLESPYPYMHAYQKSYPYDLKSSPYTFTRKTHSDWGWDWSPAWVNIGVFDSIELRAYDSAVITDVLVVQTFGIDASASQRDQYYLDPTDVLLNVTVYLRVANVVKYPLPVVVSVAISGIVDDFPMTVYLQPRSQPSNGDEVQPVSLMIGLDGHTFDLWYPNGYGARPLYDLATTVSYNSTVIDSHSQRIGFRRAFVRRLPIADQPGLTFYFEINGIPIFNKGSNLVPVSPWHVNDTELTVRFLQSAIESHQTIVRVWGGGLYLSGEVYEWADEHGLMLWQEFIFANSFYPVNSDFLTNVREEATQQIRKLSSHASLVVWCGNNEVEGDYLEGGKQDGVNHDHALVDYALIFQTVIRGALVRELGTYADGTPHTEYLMSSPANGPASLIPFSWLWGDSRDLSQGDMHYYNYGDDCSDPGKWPTPRYFTETGLQSYPSFLTFQPVTDDEDWQLDSPLMQNRQHHPDGNQQQLAQIQRHFHVPNASDARQAFDDYTYVSQAVVALCYGTLMSYFRSLRDTAPSYTMGAMYWQLNDQWQAPTWSTIEVGGRWKQNHYSVKRAFAPLMIETHLNRSTQCIQVSIVNDLQSPIAAHWTVQLIDWASGAVLDGTVSGDYSGRALSASMVLNQSVSSLAQKCQSLTQCLMRVVATVTSSECDSDSATAVETFLALSPLANVSLVDPKLSVTFLSSSSQPFRHPQDQCQWLRSQSPNTGDSGSASAGPVWSVRVSVSAVAPAAYVWLESPLSGRFTDNSFYLLPSISRTVDFIGWQPFDASEFVRTLQVRSIRDTYTREVSQSLSSARSVSSMPRTRRRGSVASVA